jgi:CubicO group peptidase (beta-lactamase class C family)
MTMAPTLQTGRVTTQPTNNSVEPVDERAMRVRVKALLNRHPTVGMAVGVVRDGHPEFFHAHGVANVASNTPIDEDTVFRIASISKTFTAIAVMQLWEKGLINLDAPANDYLRAFQLVPAKRSWRPATVRQLLTHTAGIPEMVHPSRALGYVYGESFKLGEPVPSLHEYYHGGIRLNAEPGKRFAYTDHNFSTLGQIVEDLSGQPIARYLSEHIFEPLGMQDTDLERSERVTSRLAAGYSLGSHGPKAIADRQWLTAAASMVYSSPRDVARYLAALMGGGTNEHGSMLKPATLAMMFEPQYQPDPRIPGIGLAFDRFSAGGHHVVGHEGILPGFNSQIFVAPDDQLGVMAFTNGAQMAMLWLPAETASLLSHLLGVPDDAIRSDVPQRPEVWSDICGWYPLAAPLTDMRMRAMFGLGAEVFVHRGELKARVLSPVPGLYRGFELHPDDENDPYVFRLDLSRWGIPTAKIAFGRHGGVGRMRVHLDVMPLSLERQASKSPRGWLRGALGALVFTAAVTAVRRRRTRVRRYVERWRAYGH